MLESYLSFRKRSNQLLCIYGVGSKPDHYICLSEEDTCFNQIQVMISSTRLFHTFINKSKIVPVRSISVMKA
jgi:hypothetical protein